MSEEYEWKSYMCNICGYEYNEKDGDPDAGIAPGTKREDIPDDSVCPLCGATKADFTCLTDYE